MTNTKRTPASRWTASIVRGLQQGISSDDEIAELRKVNSALADIAEKQNEACRAAIAKATGNSA